jgi:general secretion pathway protein G
MHYTKRNTRIYNGGFTLIEIMVVVVIIGILAATLLPKVTGRTDEARVTQVKQDILTLESALDLYKLDNNVYPSTDDGLEALVKKPANAHKWKEGGYMKRLGNDPWGTPYQYLSPGTHSAVDIYSLGADKQQGGEGINADIGNWDL